ncbi:Hypothetical_protein [Hexamita inflata]|uniref:Hypothetical_protein n=1 Tax=Hexamita inflata TaxID=28002 RepID=A0AA86NVZ0_9EUKA|nr:Hypothetical protein HINF_LOCUS14860 [Hexamita inflata]
MWPNNSFIRDNFNTRQQQHKLCAQYTIRTSILLKSPDFVRDSELSDSESEQLIHFENQLQTNTFRTRVFRQLISSAMHSASVSACQSFSVSENNDEEILYNENVIRETLTICNHLRLQ